MTLETLLAEHTGMDAFFFVTVHEAETFLAEMERETGRTGTAHAGVDLGTHHHFTRVVALVTPRVGRHTFVRATEVV